MKLTDIIAQAQALLAAHGDLDLLSNEGFPLHGLTMIEWKEGNPDWNIGVGEKTVEVTILD